VSDFSSSGGLPASLILFGAGKMGFSLLKGWLKAGLDPRGVSVLDPAPLADVETLCSEQGIVLNDTTRIGPSDVLVLAIKPQMLDQAARRANALIGSHTLVLSILAGTRIATLQKHLPRARGIVRAMPNLPASIGRGATGAFSDAGTTSPQRALAQVLLTSTGFVAWLEEESLLDAVTALSGSGPAYCYALIEAMEEAGRNLGLAPELATALARETLLGSAALLQESTEDAASLRRAVTSPGGTTAAALSFLQAPSGLPELLLNAMRAAYDRAQQLAQ
jgi:pyrroline-5-carboxylate reductase